MPSAAELPAAELPAADLQAMNRWSATLICGVQWGHMLQYSLISAAQSELIAMIAGGNRFMQARLTGAMFTLNFTGGLLLSPIISGLADARGRKMFLSMPSTADLLQRVVIIPFMTLNGLLASNLLGILSVAGMNMGSTALADLYKDDPVEIARWSSLFRMGASISAIVGPLVSSTLAVRDLRLPYLASAVVCVANVILCSRITETLDPKGRRVFKWASSSPFEVLKLFRNGKEL